MAVDFRSLFSSLSNRREVFVELPDDKLRSIRSRQEFMDLLWGAVDPAKTKTVRGVLPAGLYDVAGVPPDLLLTLRDGTQVTASAIQDYHRRLGLFHDPGLSGAALAAAGVIAVAASIQRQALSVTTRRNLVRRTGSVVAAAGTLLFVGSWRAPGAKAACNECHASDGTCSCNCVDPDDPYHRLCEQNHYSGYWNWAGRCDFCYPLVPVAGKCLLCGACGNCN